MFVAGIGVKGAVEGGSGERVWEGPVPGLWGTASYEMGILDHGLFGAGGERPYRNWGFWTTRQEVAWITGPGWPGDGFPSIESLHELRLRALLNDLVNDLGPGKAAEELGVDRKTLRRGLRTPELSPRLAGALERMLLAPAAAATGEDARRVKALEERVIGLERQLAQVLAAVGDGKAGDGDGVVAEPVREEYAEGLRRLERRVERQESVPGGGNAPAAPGRYGPARSGAMTTW